MSFCNKVQIFQVVTQVVSGLGHICIHAYVGQTQTGNTCFYRNQPFHLQIWSSVIKSINFPIYIYMWSDFLHLDKIFHYFAKLITLCPIMYCSVLWYMWPLCTNIMYYSLIKHISAVMLSYTAQILIIHL